MSDNLNSILDADSRYAGSFGERGNLARPPARQLAILTCMDARLDPAKFAGLSEGDAHVRRFGLESTVRPSLAFYNTFDEIDALVSAVKRLRAARPSVL